MVIGDDPADAQERRPLRHVYPAMKILVAVISPAPAWVLPRHFVEQLRRDFPQHTFLDAWDRESASRLLADVDVAFTPLVERDAFASAARLRWVQSPAVGVGKLMFPELLASPVVLTTRSRNPRPLDRGARDGRDARAGAAAAGGGPRPGRPPVGPTGSGRRPRGRPAPPRPAHGHRRTRRDRTRTREHRRAVRPATDGDPKAQRRAAAGRRRSGLDAGSAPRSPCHQRRRRPRRAAHAGDETSHRRPRAQPHQARRVPDQRRSR